MDIQAALAALEQKWQPTGSVTGTNGQQEEESLRAELMLILTENIRKAADEEMRAELRTLKVRIRSLPHQASLHSLSTST